MTAKILFVVAAAGLGMAGGLVIHQQRETHGELARDCAVLRREHQQLIQTQESRWQSRAQLAENERKEVELASAGRIERARNEIAELEQRLVKAREAAAAASNRDPEKGMARVADFRNVGRGTPAAAFQTAVWAGLAGKDEILADALTMSAPTRRRAETLLAEQASAARARAPTPERLAGLFLARELLQRAASAHVLQCTFEGERRAMLRVRMMELSERTSETTFPMELGPGGWQLVVPDSFVEGIRKKLSK